MSIQTVTGILESHALGHCQMHEHLIVRTGPTTLRFSALLIDDEALSCRELADYRAAGGGSVVDCQPGGAGRDAEALARISRESGIPVVASTGYHMPMFYPEGHWVFSDPEQALLERFSSELCEGMDDGGGRTQIRAGVVKAAIGADGPTGRFETLLRAAARAAATARVPLILHTERGAGALRAISICERAGLAPDKLLVCHADRQANDYEPHEQIARAGAMLEYDTIARPKYHDDDTERALILHMLSLGYIDRLLLSMDTTRERLVSYRGTPGIAFILKEFFPSLRRAGVSEQEIHQIAIHNPARAFS